MLADGADHCFPAALRTTSRDTRKHSQATGDSPGQVPGADGALEYAAAAVASVAAAFWSDDSAEAGCSIADVGAATGSTRPR